ncbi:MAG: hypothetical protein HY261_03955 [Chloroflexi bacterium]|nr:hypothetical protein [Chloroflexota bacterium]
MKTEKLRTLVPRLLVLAVLAGALWTQRDRIPLRALSASAGDSATIQGMIGKATYAQKKIETKIKEFEARGDADEAALNEIDEQLQGARKDLSVAWNLMSSHGAPVDIQGWYYAREKVQGTLEKGLGGLREKLSGATPQEATPQE